MPAIQRLLLLLPDHHLISGCYVLRGTRRRRNRGNAGDTEGEGRAGAVGKRGRQGEEGGEEEGGGKRQDRKMERQWRKRNRGDG